MKNLVNLVFILLTLSIFQIQLMSQWTIQRSAFVTGATGCIGGALAARLSRAGFRVVALVRDFMRAEHLKTLPGVELVEGDLDARDVMLAAMSGCDLVFHAAAKVHAAPETPAEEFTRVNLEGTRNVLAAAIENRVSSLIFFSTVAVYTERPESDDVLDETSPTCPATAYGASKLAAEKLVLERAAEGRIKATVLRLPVVYGPRDRGNVGKLIEAIERGRYFIVGDGKNLKSMVAVGNVVEAALLAADDERARGQTYLVCDQRPYTQREIAETILSLLGRNLKPFQLPYEAAMPLGLAADLIGKITGLKLPLSVDRVRKLANNTHYSARKIERELGFKPRLTLHDGLAEIIECFSRGSRE